MFYSGQEQFFENFAYISEIQQRIGLPLHSLHFQKMKKLQFLKADDYMKTITFPLNSNLSAVNLAVSFIAASCPVKSSPNIELSYMLLLNY